MIKDNFLEKAIDHIQKQREKALNKEWVEKYKPFEGWDKVFEEPKVFGPPSKLPNDFVNISDNPTIGKIISDFRKWRWIK